MKKFVKTLIGIVFVASVIFLSFQKNTVTQINLFKENYLKKDYKTAREIYEKNREKYLYNKFDFIENITIFLEENLAKSEEQYLNNKSSYEDTILTIKETKTYKEVNVHKIKKAEEKVKNKYETKNIAKNDSKNEYLKAKELLSNKNFESALKKIESSLRSYDNDKNAMELKKNIVKTYKTYIFKEVNNLINKGNLNESLALLGITKKLKHKGESAPTMSSNVSNSNINNFINNIGLKSKTKFLVWVDINSQKTNIFSSTNGQWNLIRSMDCSTGKVGSETPKGTYTLNYRGTWFFSNKYDQGAKYWISFYGDYLFHSLPMDINRNIVDYTLGEPSSHGCIRLPVDDSEWIYNNIPNGTTVYIK